MSSVAIKLGTFELLEVVGKGATGQVYRAQHCTEGLLVAVKVITSEHARDPKVRAAFHNEVRAVAGLHHPGIAMVLDYGRVSAEAARLSDGALVESSPYLAMEYASGGTLPRPRGPMPWPRLRSLIFELLDALAHAHARGVIHRDIKPGNILLAPDGNGNTIHKLTDFGIARALGSIDESGGLISGTPQYMAPEQILDQVRDQGPWTDLYALGCLVYLFATGQRMFPGVKGTELLRHQVQVHPSPITAPYLPNGLQAWLERMLAKHPAQRFQLAADAAWGLAQLAEPESPQLLLTESYESIEQRGAEESEAFAPAPPFALRSTAYDPNELPDELVDDGIGDTIRVDREDALGTAELRATAVRGLSTLADIVEGGQPLSAFSASLTPPLPTAWRCNEALATPLKLVGAGLGLFGLRSIPLVDRELERDHIWQALHRVTDDHHAQLVLLKGGAGQGKSRLAQWCCQRANELGAALVLQATHSPIAGPADGLGPMIAHQLAIMGLDRANALQRCKDFLSFRMCSTDDAPALVELALPIDLMHDPDIPRVRFASPEERFDVIIRFIQCLCDERAVILWLDDAQWSADSLAFALYLLQHPQPQQVPVLMLATCRDDAAIRPLEQQLLAQLSTLADTAPLHVGPLPPADHLALVEELLGLERELALSVAERTAGNPLFAIQLVGDWVERGVLVLGEHGFKLKAGEQGILPDDIHDLWASRLQQILRNAHATENDWLSLELAAALGKDVHLAEWNAAAQAEGLSTSSELLETLLAHRLIEGAGEWLTFAHGMLRESLERSAREHRRLRKHHLACAQMLERLYPQHLHIIAERRGEHLVQAGELGAALEPLLQGAILRMKTGDYSLSHALFARREEVMRLLGVSQSDARWGLGWVRQAQACTLAGDNTKAETLATRAAQQAEQHNWPLIAGIAHCELGRVATEYGDTLRSGEYLQQAITLLERLIEPSAHRLEPTLEQRQAEAELADAFIALARNHYMRFEIEQSEALIRRAIPIQQRLGDEHGLGKSIKELATCHLSRDELEAAAAALEQALSIFDHHGFRWDSAACLNNLGEVARKRSEFGNAEWYYRRAAEVYQALGSQRVTTPRFNLALMMIQHERFDDAYAILDAERERLQAHGFIADILWVYAGLIPCLAARGDWAGYYWFLETLQEQLAQNGVIEEDFPICAEIAGKVAYAQGQLAAAAAAFQHARQQYSGLSDHASVERIDAWLHACA
ncbi:MAG: protein kinase [Myxococcota bacterium]|jgi:serine/threonine protein kinase/tetratricopeptide (TPR) repeat protein|nr:protein kinase [Myxococcota bacterium]